MISPTRADSHGSLKKDMVRWGCTVTIAWTVVGALGLMSTTWWRMPVSQRMAPSLHRYASV